MPSCCSIPFAPVSRLHYCSPSLFMTFHVRAVYLDAELILRFSAHNRCDDLCAHLTRRCATAIMITMNLDRYIEKESRKRQQLRLFRRQHASGAHGQCTVGDRNGPNYTQAHSFRHYMRLLIWNIQPNLLSNTSGNMGITISYLALSRPPSPK